MWKKPNEIETQEAPLVTDAPRASARPAGGPDKNPGSVIGSSITVSGDISGNEDLLVVGKMEGTVTFPNNDIHIGPGGDVNADMSALKISVEGKVHGDLRGSERVVIKQSGRVVGNIIAPRVVLEDGCQFKGSVEMNMEPKKAAAGAVGDAREPLQNPAKTTSPAPAKAAPTPDAAKSGNYDSKIKTRASSAS